MQKNVFLDLAFFLIEAWRISLDHTRCLYGSSAHIEICVLKERSLISVHENGDIEMHALLMEMGLEISRQQLISNPEKTIRLWRHEDIYNFFNNEEGAKAIQCLSLDMSKIKRITLTSSNFQKMCNLKFLKLYKSDRKKPSKVNIFGDHLDSLPDELKFLCWVDCPLQSVPLSFCAENLVHLTMPNNHLQQLWSGNPQFPNLKNIDVSGSKYLTALPDLSGAPNLESVGVDGCVNLDQIHSSTVLGKLTNLTLESCEMSRQINFGGSVNGTRNSGLVTVNNFFDLNDFSFTKVTMKLLVSDDGQIITGFKFKLVLMPFEEILECKEYIESVKLILWTQSLAFLLPFVRDVHWSESPIEFGNFKNHFECDHYYDSYFFGERIQIKMKRVEGVKKRAQSGVVCVWPLTVRDEEDDDGVELMGEVECCSKNDKNTLTRVPNDIPRWSLLTQVSLKKSDIIGNAGWSIPQVSSLRSFAGSEYCSAGLQTLKDIRLCLDVAARDWCGLDFCVSYCHSPEWFRAMAGGVLSLSLFVFGTDIVF